MSAAGKGALMNILAAMPRGQAIALSVGASMSFCFVVSSIQHFNAVVPAICTDPEWAKAEVAYRKFQKNLK